MLLRHYIEPGMSKRSIARKLKISPDTLYRWVRSGDLDRDVDEAPVQYGPRPPVPTKLDPFKLLIQARLDAFPQLSSVRLLEDIQADGYGGGYTQDRVPTPIQGVRQSAQVRFTHPEKFTRASWKLRAACSGRLSQGCEVAAVADARSRTSA